MVIAVLTVLGASAESMFFAVPNAIAIFVDKIFVFISGLRQVGRCPHFFKGVPLVIVRRLLGVLLL